eukprot:Em0001g1322a
MVKKETRALACRNFLHPARYALQVPRVQRIRMEPLEPPVQKETKEIPGLQVLRDQRETRDQREIKDIRETQASPESKVKMVLQARMASKGQRVTKEMLEHLEVMAYQEWMEHKALLVLLLPLTLLVPLDLKDHKDPREMLVLRDLKELLG